MQLPVIPPVRGGRRGHWGDAGDTVDAVDVGDTVCNFLSFRQFARNGFWVRCYDDTPLAASPCRTIASVNSHHAPCVPYTVITLAQISIWPTVDTTNGR
jgi:hypothetical protein